MVKIASLRALSLVRVAAYNNSSTLNTLGSELKLYVKINGKRRRLFINRQEGVIGIIAERKKRRGYRFYDWASIQDVYYPTGKDEKETVMKEVLKYKKLARLATHTNAWLRQIADADPEKSLFENHITTGTTIDGKCIRLSTIEKYVWRFLSAMTAEYTESSIKR